MSRFDADDPVSMCQKNAAVAAALNRPDLVQVKHVVDVHLRVVILVSHLDKYVVALHLCRF